MKILIIDDEPSGIAAIRLVIERNYNRVTISECGDVNCALKKIREEDPDIVFLDIEMPGATGFDLLDELPGRRFELLFVTAFENYAVKAFKVNAVDYVLKPFTEEELLAAYRKAEQKIMERALRTISAHSNSNGNNHNFLPLPTTKGLEIVKMEDIIQCCADQSYTVFYLTGKRKILVSRNLQEFERLLNPVDFIRIHHSNIINLRHVTQYIKGRGGYVVLSDGSHADVSVRKKAEFMERLGLGAD